MTKTVQDHEITISLVQAPPAEIAAGADMVVKAQVVCSAGCDLRTTIGRIIAQDDEVIREFYFNQFYGTNEMDALILKAPVTPGEYTWKAVFPEQVKDGITHAEASTSFTVVVGEQHQTSIAVWDVDSPVTAGAPFKLKVGMSCSAGCRLSGKEIEIRDQQGALLAAEKLGEDIWAGTEALYWTEVGLRAPDTLGFYSWTASFSELESRILHRESCSTFGIIVVEPPDCKLTVEVTDHESGLPISNADVVLSSYRSRTDENGIVNFELLKGEYQMHIVKGKYDVYTAFVTVPGNLNIAAALKPKTAKKLDID